MASSEVLISRDVSFTLASAGASGIFTMGCASGTGVQSNVFDLGEPHSDMYEFMAEVVFSVAPTVGGLVNFYFAPANNQGRFPGYASGINGGYRPNGVTLVQLQEGLPQLSYIGSIVAANTSGVQCVNRIIGDVGMRSGCIVMFNNAGTLINIGNAGQSGNICLTPLVPICSSI